MREEPFTLTYRIERKAEWSDGTPVTADDFVFTLETLLDPANQIADRGGHVRIVQATALDAKTVRFVFDRPYPAWKSLFPHVLPKHALEGSDFDTVWTDGITNPATGEPIGSGPFLLTAWNRGVKMTLSRNPNWWGRRPAFLDAIDIRFFPFSQAAMTQALADGSIDVMSPQTVQPALAGLPGIELQTSQTPFFEHISFNVASTTTPLLREKWFREAVAYALDREGATAEVSGPSAARSRSWRASRT